MEIVQKTKKIKKVVLYIILILLFVSLFVSMGTDYCTYPYISESVKKFFCSYSIGNLIAIDVVTWTFTVTLAIYYLGKMEKSSYGIAKVKLISADIGGEVLIFLSIMVAFELLCLIITAILEWRITLVFVTFIEYLTMIYIFYLVCRVTLYNNVIELIRDEFLVMRGERKKSKIPMFADMIQEMNYKKEKDCSALERILKDITPECGMQDAIKVMEWFLQSKRGLEKKIEILRVWFLYDKTTPEIQKGMIIGLLDKMNRETYYACIRFLSVVGDNQKELYVWTIVYNIFMQQYAGLEWRAVYTEDMLRIWNQSHVYKEGKLALKHWEEIHRFYNKSDERCNNITLLSKYFEF